MPRQWGSRTTRPFGVGGMIRSYSCDIPGRVKRSRSGNLLTSLPGSCDCAWLMATPARPRSTPTTPRRLNSWPGVRGAASSLPVLAEYSHPPRFWPNKTLNGPARGRREAENLHGFVQSEPSPALHRQLTVDHNCPLDTCTHSHPPPRRAGSGRISNGCAFSASTTSVSNRVCITVKRNTVRIVLRSRYEKRITGKTG